MLYYGTSELDSCVISYWNDGGLGYAFDDYIAFDSTRRMAVLYNSDANDPTYASNLTQTGTILLKAPNDNASFNDPLGSFTFYENNQIAPTGNPNALSEYYRYMTGTWRDNLPFTKSCNMRDTNYPIARYAYTDDPMGAGFNEVSCANIPGDRRFLMNTKPFKMIPGMAPIHFLFAIVNPNLGVGYNDLSSLKSIADFVIANPDGCGIAQPTGTNSIKLNEGFLTYPNPTANSMAISWPGHSAYTIKVFNPKGQCVIEVKSSTSSYNLNTSALSKGVYFIQVDDKNQKLIEKMIIQ